MEKVKTFLKDLFLLVSNVRQLEKDVENLETKVLAPEEVSNSSFYYMNSLMDYWWGGGSDRQMTLEEKVEAIAKVLKIEFEWTEEKDRILVAKIEKRKKKK